MRIYFAGNLDEWRCRTIIARVLSHYSSIGTHRTYLPRLDSFYHLLDNSACRYCLLFNSNLPVDGTTDDMVKNTKIFIDSGAFSAYTQGITIDIDRYITFIKEHESCIDVYANLDVIGDPKATLKNQQYMEAMGLNPMPVYHLGSPEKYLKFYISRYEYVGIGGMLATGTTRRQVVLTLDRLFSEYICDDSGLPRVKVHGFGLTSLRLMMRYPWFSVDSTSWLINAKIGAIFVPIPWKDILHKPWRVCVSSRSPSRKDPGKHLNTLPPSQRRYVLRYISNKGFRLGRSEFRLERTGYELKEDERPTTGRVTRDGRLTRDQRIEVIIEPGVCNQFVMRDQLNIMYFSDLEDAMPEWPWPFRKTGKQLGVIQ